MKTRNDIPDSIRDIILGTPRGNAGYQCALLDGSESWSGASLQGKAKQWGARYAASRAALLRAINRRLPAGWSVATGLLLCGTPARYHRMMFVSGPEADYAW